MQSAPKRAHEEMSLLVLNDHNAWYYPSQGLSSDDEDLAVSIVGGNWGNKMRKGSRWVRKGKMAAWGPGMDDWEAEDRARKRIKCLLPERRSPSPPCLPHMRSPTPPLLAPYPPPIGQHFSFASFVMDKSVTHSFRSSLLDELEDPDRQLDEERVIPKQEEQEDIDDEEDEQERRMARAPDLTPTAHKLFLVSYVDNGPPVIDPSQFASPEMQQDSLEKSLATLRELQDDGREYVERLQEIREGLGDTRAQRNIIWEMVREKAIKELQDVAFSVAMD
ncbi:hypothetical protein EDD22DRAFT_858806 [Suillus occidentalis]|nr:hypothetical protein EDD22DRAFT_858806 [Suillus occidentalis]